MSKAQASVGNYRVDWFEDNIAQCFGFFDAVKAWEKYVEGVAKAYDEVMIYNFAGGKGSAVLLARHCFNNGRYFYGKEEIKASRDTRKAPPTSLPQRD